VKEVNEHLLEEAISFERVECANMAR